MYQQSRLNSDLNFFQKIKNLEKKIFKISKKEFNIASPKQLGEIIYNELKITGLKKTKKGALPTWVKVGKTDLNYVEVKEGIENNEVVYVLPSEGLIKYQQKFSERVKGRFG